MRILILGGDGMLGHQLLKHLRGKHETRVTLRRPLADYSAWGLFDAAHAVGDIDVRNFERIQQVTLDFRPDAIVNAIGVVKQRAESADSIIAIETNSLLPHRLSFLCSMQGIRLVHLSTDCVFSGRRGNYSERDAPDAEDLYGRSKLLGEVTQPPGITLRTSIIGRELSRKTGLLEWFLAQKTPIKGFRKAIFSGFTTREMSRIIERVLAQSAPSYGLYHVSSTPINKHDLLLLIRDKLGLPTEIVADDAFECDRSLDSTRFRQAFGYAPPSWDAMISELAELKGK